MKRWWEDKPSQKAIDVWHTAQKDFNEELKKMENGKTKSDSAKEILKDVVDFEDQSNVAVFIKNVGKMLLLGCTYEEFLQLMVEFRDVDLLDTTAFIWAGTNASQMHHYQVTLRISEIVYVEEVTDDVWVNYVTSARQASFAGSGLVPPGGPQLH